MSNLSFDILREANRTRLPLFKNGKGELAHTDADGSDWSPSDWMTALVGEVGEAANLLKKLRRGDFTLDDGVHEHGKTITVRAWLAKELADSVCYLDLLANRFGIDLGEAVVAKFNEISQRVDVPVFIVPGEEDRYEVSKVNP